MKVLIACEYSGTVRDAFANNGHDATSCDFEPAETLGKHYQGNVFDIIHDGWDLMIAHPPCERLCVSGARWLYEKPNWAKEQGEAVEFALKLWGAPIAKIALENPVGILSRHIGPPSQIVQPWQFGHPETKATCLWLKNLPLLMPTHGDGLFTEPKPEHIEARVHKLPPSPMRKKLRAWRYKLIAEQMALQWGVA